jgi:IS30 family transposase
MRSYAHLSEDERDQIGVLRAAGRSMGAIARALGRNPPISRELQRNALPSGGYSPLHAAGAYQVRRRREAILEREAALRLFVGDRLADGWTSLMSVSSFSWSCSIGFRTAVLAALCSSR